MSLASQSYLHPSSRPPNPPSTNTQSPVSLPPPYLSPPESEHDTTNASTPVFTQIPLHQQQQTVAYSSAYMNRIGFTETLQEGLKSLFSNYANIPWNPYPFLYSHFQRYNQLLVFINLFL